MSIPLLNAAWKCRLPSPATAMTKLVLLKLADHADGSGYCYPSVERICADAQMGRSTVLRHMCYLEDAGLIRRRPGHTGRNTAYTLIWP